jgi:ribosomal protein S18 acetylase RimI-like enzyme
MTPVIRPAVAADTPVLSQLADRLFLQTFVEELAVPYPKADLDLFLRDSNGPEAMAKRLADPAVGVWLALIAGGAVGYMVAGPAYGFAHPDLRAADGMLHRLYIAPETRGRGLGPAMMDVVMDWLARRYGARPWLTVFSGNIRAQRFYARYGFEKVGEFDYPVGAWLDHEFMMRKA